MRPTTRKGYVYVLHFDRPLAGRASHYIGCTCDIRQRLITHATGRGAKIVQAALAQDIGFRLAALGTCPVAVMRRLERQLKNWKGCEHQCGICQQGEEAAIPGTTPLSLENIEWPLHSTDLAKLAPPLDTITVRLTTDQDPLSLNAGIKRMMNDNKHALGFIAVGGETGISHSLVRGRVAIALLGSVLVGYAAFTENAELQTIHQVCVSDAVRGMGIGRRLVECVRSARPHLPAMCRVKDELPANAFWQAIGFKRDGTTTHETSGSQLNIYRHPAA